MKRMSLVIFIFGILLIGIGTFLLMNNPSDYVKTPNNNDDNNNSYFVNNSKQVIVGNMRLLIPNSFNQGYFESLSHQIYNYGLEEVECVIYMDVYNETNYDNINDYINSNLSQNNMITNTTKTINNIDWKTLIYENDNEINKYNILLKDNNFYQIKFTIFNNGDNNSCSNFYDQIINTVEVM